MNFFTSLYGAMLHIDFKTSQTIRLHKGTHYTLINTFASVTPAVLFFYSNWNTSYKHLVTAQYKQYLSGYRRLMLVITIDDFNSYNKRFPRQSGDRHGRSRNWAFGGD